MAKIAGRNARTFIDRYSTSCDSNSATLNITVEAPEVTAFCDNSRARLSNGISDVELSQDGFFNNSASAIDEALQGLLGSQVLAAVYFSGLAGSAYGREFTGVLTQYQPAFQVADAAGISFTIAGSGGVNDVKSIAGSALNAQGIPTVSAVGSSTLGSIDLKGATDALGTSELALRVLTLTGTTPTFSASIQYSADDSAYTTAYVLSNIAPSSIGASSIALASASRYAKAIVALTGTSPCATFMLACGSKR